MAIREIKDIEELKSLVGKEVAVSDWVEVTQERVQKFAEATGDFQWIHLDAERCKTESPFGAPVAHGFLTLSMMPYLDNISYRLAQEFKVQVNAGLNKARLIQPVVVGSRIRSRKKLIEVADMDGAHRINWKVTIEIEGEKHPALIAEVVMRLRN